MPVVTVRMVDDQPTPEQKARVVREITDTLARVLGKNPATTHVVLELVAPENWGHGGELVAERRRRDAEGG